ncbi:unnamed protein product [Adineta ricciae]|uniref:EGF-like domain-containing protein n=1 Tax=Adineta ricciae TaxID=249248 RepID=A0A814A2Z2_ADIRI|nr:unnamed protein product [Adineta ricciae]
MNSCIERYLFRFVDGFYLSTESEDYVGEPEPCNARCQNNGECFLSSFCICPKGFSGRYCEISLDEQCGTFPSMTRMEIDCVLCICYNGIFMCDVLPTGFCRPKFHKSMNRSIRINHAFHVLQYRFKHIQSFEPMTRYNVTLDDDIQPINLHGYRILLNHCSSAVLSIFFIWFSCLLSMSLKIFSVL